MGDPHDWNNWNSYRMAHENYMRHFASYWIIEDQLEIIETPVLVQIKGIIYCIDGVEIHVDKSLDVRLDNGRIYVRTFEYSYHVQRRTKNGIRELFRYDNAHDRPRHPDRHHKHIFNEDGTATVVHVGYAGWPTLGDVIKEAYEWWEENIEEEEDREREDKA